MHAMGTRALNLDTSAQLLNGKNWNGFKNFSVVCKDMSFDNYQSESGYRVYKNQYMKIIESVQDQYGVYLLYLYFKIKGSPYIYVHIHWFILLLYFTCS